MATETSERFWSGDAKEFLQMAIIAAVLGLGVGSCSMLEDYGEAAKIAAKCKTEAK